jgi:thioredoxin-dependent peroxiredoxin
MKKSMPLILILLWFSGRTYSQETRKKELRKGDTIPFFQLPDQDGHWFKSSDHIGKNTLVIFFYPKDESMVCTKEACGFRDHYAELSRLGAVVVGINSGSVESHKKFQAKDQLPYSLLSDSAGQVLRLFGVPKQLFMTGRMTYIADRTGKIVFSYNSAMNGTKHSQEVLAYLERNNSP